MARCENVAGENVCNSELCDKADHFQFRGKQRDSEYVVLYMGKNAAQSGFGHVRPLQPPVVKLLGLVANSCHGR